MRPSLLAVCLVFVAAARAARAADWTQFGFDARHSGDNPLETAIHARDVASLHALWTTALPAVVDGAPILLGRVATPSGTRDLLYLTTRDGRLVAVDARSGAIAWARQAATGPGFTTSSPAADPGRAFVYSCALDGRVHKYAAADGTETTTGGWPETVTLKGDVEKCSSALAVSVARDGVARLHVAASGYPGDLGSYEGHLTTIDLDSGAQRVFNVPCSDRTVHLGTSGCGTIQGAIWGRGAAAYDAAADRLWTATGNGLFNAASGGRSWGDSVLALRPDGSAAYGVPLDSYTPTGFAALQSGDTDLGSTTPALLPRLAASRVPDLLLQVGKDGVARLLDGSDPSGAGGPGHVGGELGQLRLPFEGEVAAQPAVAQDSSGALRAFVANGNGLAALRVALDAEGTPSLVVDWAVTPGGTSPVVANGILYCAGNGSLRALDARTGAVLWSAGIGATHWQSPIVAGGRVYVADETPALRAFGPAAAPLGFHTATPCRVLDTRAGSGGAVAAGDTRVFAVAGACAVPSDALAVSANVTAIPGASGGSLSVVPAGTAPGTNTVAFRAGRLRAGAALLALTGSPVGSVSVTNRSGAPVDVVLDVSGWFR